MESNQLDEESAAITSELEMIEHFYQERNQKYQQCIDAYLNHLNNQTALFEESEAPADRRNETITSVFAATYDSILASSELVLFAMKNTALYKKKFWQNLLANNAKHPDLEMKRNYVLNRNDAEERYFEITNAQKLKKPSYTAFVGRTDKRKTLQEWEVNNREFEMKVQEGAKTLQEWGVGQAATAGGKGTVSGGRNSGFASQSKKGLTSGSIGFDQSIRDKDRMEDDSLGDDGDFISRFRKT